jgi:hypothetical protein
MAIKRDQYTYLGGMNVDAPASKRMKNQYFMLKNGRITSSYSDGDFKNIASNGTVRCQSGNELLFAFTSIESISANSGNLKVQYKIDNVIKSKTFTGIVNSEIVALNSLLPNNTIEIISAVSDGPYAYFCTTSEDSIDCIWKYSEVGGLELLYINSLGWNDLTEKNLDIVINIESDVVTKIYIADGEHQIFSINLATSADVAKPQKVLYMVPQYSMSEPFLRQQISGGQHTSGAIQYVYNLFNINGGQTKVSTASELIFLGKTNNGGDINEIVGKTNIIEIDYIDSNYDYIRVYSIKYGSLNAVPIVSVIGEYAAPTAGQLIVTDDGRVKYNISIEALTFLGGNEIIPRAIIAKKNRLLLANIKEDIFDINANMLIDDADYFDSRAYSSNVGGGVYIKDKFDTESMLDSTARAYTMDSANVPIKHDVIQDKDIYYYNPATFPVPGGQGRHISYEVKKTPFTDFWAAGYDPNATRHMKVGETYRWAIEFYNNKSQKSTPQWMADIKVPADYYGFIDDTRVTIEFTISAAGIELLKNQGIIGYKYRRVERLESDRTIVAQGIVTSMIFQEISDAALLNSNEALGVNFVDHNAKVSCPWVRHYQDQIDVAQGSWYDKDVKINALSQNACISEHSTLPISDNSPWPFPEIYRDCDTIGNAGLHISYQDNRLMQLYSPETIFGNPSLYDGMKIRPVMSLTQSYRRAHGKLILTDTNDISKDVTSLYNTANLFLASKYSDQVTGNYLHANGYIGPNKPIPTTPGIKSEQLIQYYREYEAGKILSLKTDGSTNDYDVLGAPELAKHDSSLNVYNGYSRYKYGNSLQSILADGRHEMIGGGGGGSFTPIYGVDAISAKNITFVESREWPYESIFSNAFSRAGETIASTDNVMLAEVIAVVENQYGGHYYEDRSVNKYIPVGKYQRITTGDHVYNIINCGDVFVNDFIFARISRLNGAQFSDSRLQMAEIVRFPVETTVNIKERSDNSYGGWESSFLPTNEEFHKYNPIYSQEANAIYSMPDPFLFVKNTHFTNRILATKPKIAGETIDSWTDVLVNEEMYLEGEYGRINRLIKYNDTLYCFQRDGVSVVSVLPRVQVSASDSIAIELGLGSVLNNYQYINTNSGCDDFNGVISTSAATYYGDRIRRTINIIEGATVSGLSDTLGMSQYVKGFDTDMTFKPNYSLGFNMITDDVLFTIQRQSGDGFGSFETLMYDEGIKKFTSILDLPAAFIFSIDAKMHSVSQTDRSQVWNHFIGGNSCKFYGEQKKLELTLCLNPEGAINDNIFNMIEWTHDIVDTSDLTHYDGNITEFSAWNDYQTASSTTISTDVRRRFRMSRLFIPRSTYNNFDRMRGHYLFVTLKYLPDSPNHTIILNDVMLYYNSQR